MARKKKHEEHVNMERWLVSYANFITLLFAFIVVMYSVSSVNEGKYRVLSEAMVAAFRSSAKSMEPIQVGNPAKTPFDAPLSIKKKPAVVVPKVSIPVKKSDTENPFDEPGKGDAAGAQGDTAGSAGAGSAAMEALAQALEQALSALIAEDLVKVKRTELWVEIEINSSLLFDQGEAVLDESIYPVLEKIAQLIQPFPYPLRVEGHTDSMPVENKVFASNWALSAARAADVVKRLEDGGIERSRLAAIGLADTQPISENDTPEGQAKNRRVKILIMSTPDPKRKYDTDNADLIERDTGLQPSQVPLPEGVPAGGANERLPVLDSRSSLSESAAEPATNAPQFESSTLGGEAPIVEPIMQKPIRPITLPPVIAKPIRKPPPEPSPEKKLP